jgi:quinol monooxygenase YgiN
MDRKMSDLIVIASATAKPGKESELEQALREVAAPTRAQPGWVAFTLYRMQGSKAMLVGLERWASAADHQRHLQGAHVQKLMSRMADILAGPADIVSYEVIDG